MPEDDYPPTNPEDDVPLPEGAEGSETGGPEPPPTDPESIGSLDDAAAASMIEAALEGGADDIPDDPFGEDGAHTDPDESPPGLGPSTVDLPPEDRKQLARLLCSLLDDHDAAVAARRSRLDRVMANYNMQVDPQRTGIHPDSAQLCSEMTKASCDQVKARLSGSFRNTKDLIRVTPWDEAAPPGQPDPVSLAGSMERFMRPYAESEIQIRKYGPNKVQTAVQQGSAVSYDMWEVETERVYYYADDGELDSEDVTTAGIRSRPIHYRDFVLWPLTIDDWQKEYQIVGHRGRAMSRAEYSTKLRDRGISESDIEDFTHSGHEHDPEIAKQIRDGDDVDVSVVDQDFFQEYELWLRMAIGPLEFGKYQVFLDREREEVTRIAYNPLHCQQHPYRDLHYKPREGWAFAEGVGEELIQAQAIDSTIDNMEVDNWKVVGQNVVFYDENMVADSFMTELYPGGRYGMVGSPRDGILVEQLGGPIEALQEAKNQNNFRAMRATGLPPVMSGVGDPVMKSGADATSVMALLSEAGRKVGDIDQTIKECFSAQVEYWFELIAQYAPRGLFADRLSPRHALPLEALKFVPPRGRLKGRFRVEVMAPSPSSNRELQKQSIMVLNQMADNYLLFIEQHGMEIYGALGQQTQVLDLKRQVFEYKTRIWSILTELHEIPGLEPLQPKLEEPTPEEERIDQLMREAQQLQQQMGMVMAVKQRADQILGEMGPEAAGAVQQANQRAMQEVQQQAQQAAQAGGPGQPGESPGQQPGGGLSNPAAAPGMGGVDAKHTDPYSGPRDPMSTFDERPTRLLLAQIFGPEDDGSPTPPPPSAPILRRLRLLQKALRQRNLDPESRGVLLGELQSLDWIRNHLPDLLFPSRPATHRDDDAPHTGTHATERVAPTRGEWPDWTH